MEGVERYKVRLLSHNSEWEKEYEETKKQITEIWNNNILSIEHVGSTAIKNICAKPILDIAVRLKSIDNMDVKSITCLGYDYCGKQGDNSKHHLFVLRDKNMLSLRHIHCYNINDNEFFQLTAFRDYLNAHPDEAVKYMNLKFSLQINFKTTEILILTAKKILFWEYTKKFLLVPKSFKRSR